MGLGRFVPGSEDVLAQPWPAVQWPRGPQGSPHFTGGSPPTPHTHSSALPGPHLDVRPVWTEGWTFCLLRAPLGGARGRVNREALPLVLE